MHKKKIKIAYPDNSLCSLLVENAERVKTDFDVELFKVKETHAAKLLLANKVDIALISPLAYAETTGKADIRMIPTYCLTSFGATGILNLRFKKNLTTINTVCVEQPEDFLMIASKILLFERYEMNIELKKGSATDPNDNTCDATITYVKSNADDALDISEDWLDTFDNGLPIYNWAARFTEDHELLTEITSKLASDAIKVKSDKATLSNLDLIEKGKGILQYEWDDKHLAAMEQINQLLFYHRFAKNISDMRLLEPEI